MSDDAAQGVETPPAIDFAALAAPFKPEAVHWRVGSVTADGDRGLALAYLDARDVMDRLDEVCGPTSWKCSHREMSGRTICTLSVRFRHPDGSYEWIGKEDGAEDTDIEGAKGGLSDALKRVAVLWGVGRYLYRLDSPWVLVEGPDKKRKRIVKGEYAKLAAILGAPAPPPSKPQNDPPPPADDPLPIAAEIKAKVAMCVRIIKQKRSQLGMVKPDETDAQESTAAQGICGELTRGFGKTREDDWTMELALQLENEARTWKPDDFAGPDAPLTKAQSGLLHAQAGEQINTQEAHDTVHQAAVKIGLGGFGEADSSHFDKLASAITAIGVERGTWKEPGA